MMICARCRTPSIRWVTDRDGSFLRTVCTHCGGSNTDMPPLLTADDDPDVAVERKHDHEHEAA